MKNLVLVAIVTASLMTQAGCQDKRRHKASEQVEFGKVDLALEDEAKPDVVARAFLETAQDMQRVRIEGLGKEGNAQRYDDNMARLMALSASKTIYNKVKPRKNAGSPFVPVDITEDAAVRHIVSLWVSKIAYYADGMDMDTLSKGNETKQAEQTYSVIATNAQEAERLAAITAAFEKKRTDDTPAKGSKEYWAALRKQTLPQGFNVPIEARITVLLARVGATWRVTEVLLGPLD